MKRKQYLFFFLSFILICILTTGKPDKSAKSPWLKGPYWVDGKYANPKNLGAKVNSTFNEFNPYIASDESYLIFNSPNRPGGLGQQDLYITFKDQEGRWLEPKNMGRKINTEYNGYSAIVTGDGKYLFFSSNRMMKSSSGYRVDIFWVDAKIIEELKPREIK